MKSWYYFEPQKGSNQCDYAGLRICYDTLHEKGMYVEGRKHGSSKWEMV